MQVVIVVVVVVVVVVIVVVVVGVGGVAEPHIESAVIRLTDVQACEIIKLNRAGVRLSFAYQSSAIPPTSPKTNIVNDFS